MQEERLIKAIIVQAFKDLSIDISRKCRVGGNSLCERLIYRNWAVNFFNGNDFKWYVEKIDKKYIDCFGCVTQKVDISKKEYLGTIDKIKIEKEVKNLPLFAKLLIKNKKIV